MKEKAIEQKMYIWHFNGCTNIEDVHGIWATDDYDFEEKLERHLKNAYYQGPISEIPYWILTDINHNQVTRNIVLVKEDE